MNNFGLLSIRLYLLSTSIKSFQIKPNIVCLNPWGPSDFQLPPSSQLPQDNGGIVIQENSVGFINIQNPITTLQVSIQNTESDKQFAKLK